MTDAHAIATEVADLLAERIGPRWPRWLDVETAAEYCSVSGKSIRRLVSAGKLHPSRAVRGKLLFDRIELDSVFAAERTTPRKGRGIRN